MNTAAAPIDEVVDLLRALHLPHMRRTAPELLATAKAQRWEPAEAMRALLTEELAGRRRSSVAARRKAAGFPTGTTFETWDDTTSSIAVSPLTETRGFRSLKLALGSCSAVEVSHVVWGGCRVGR